MLRLDVRRGFVVMKQPQTQMYRPWQRTVPPGGVPHPPLSTGASWESSFLMLFFFLVQNHRQSCGYMNINMIYYMFLFAILGRKAENGCGAHIMSPSGECCLGMGQYGPGHNGEDHSVTVTSNDMGHPCERPVRPQSASFMSAHPVFLDHLWSLRWCYEERFLAILKLNQTLSEIL